MSEADGRDATADVHAKAGGVLAMRPLISRSSGSSVEGSRLPSTQLDHPLPPFALP